MALVFKIHNPLSFYDVRCAVIRPDKVTVHFAVFYANTSLFEF